MKDESSESKTCPHCGADNAAEAVLCKRCQAYLPEEAATLAGLRFLPRPQEALGAAVWCAVGGAAAFTIALHEGERHVLGLGAASAEGGTDLTPYRGRESGISRRHARLIRTGGAVAIEDLGSRNGTYINGIWAFPYLQHPLQDGDIVRLGGLWLRLHYDRL